MHFQRSVVQQGRGGGGAYTCATDAVWPPASASSKQQRDSGCPPARLALPFALPLPLPMPFCPTCEQWSKFPATQHGVETWSSHTASIWRQPSPRLSIRAEPAEQWTQCAPPSSSCGTGLESCLCICVVYHHCAVATPGRHHPAEGPSFRARHRDAVYVRGVEHLAATLHRLRACRPQQPALGTEMSVRGSRRQRCLT